MLTRFLPVLLVGHSGLSPSVQVLPLSNRLSAEWHLLRYNRNFLSDSRSLKVEEF